MLKKGCSESTLVPYSLTHRFFRISPELITRLEGHFEYPPGSASISQLEPVAIKGQTVTLSCQLGDLGHPPASRYLWESPTRTISNNGSSNQVLSMGRVNASAEGVYFCAGRNDVGTGPLGHFTLKLSGWWRFSQFILHEIS
ncbi:ig-like domain-containing protein [Trichonephila clavipes]|nr:ig-like domain-containing protein [Trichonephila clavipes]